MYNKDGSCYLSLLDSWNMVVMTVMQMKTMMWTKIVTLNRAKTVIVTLIIPGKNVGHVGSGR